MHTSAPVNKKQQTPTKKYKNQITKAKRQQKKVFLRKVDYYLTVKQENRSKNYI